MSKQKKRPPIRVYVDIDERGEVHTLPDELQQWLNRMINDAFRRGVERTLKRQGKDKPSDIKNQPYECGMAPLPRRHRP